MKLKKRIRRIQCDLPVLGDDDFPFAVHGESGASQSFVDVFDASLFDADVKKRQQQKRLKGPSAEPMSSWEQLDLHGFTSAQAELAVIAFLNSVGSRGVKTVRIITGKGLHSQAGPILPGVVEDLLRVMLAQKEIKGFYWEKRIKEQSGAVIVAL